MTPFLRALCAVIPLVCSVGLPTAAQAEPITRGDVGDWSAFAAQPADPARLVVRSDLIFKAISHEGPFSPEREARLPPDVSRLHALLRAARWTEALAWLKSAQPDVNRRDETGYTPLSACARAGELALVRELIRQGARPDQVGADGMTPLGAAAWGGHELVVRDLLRAGARLDVPGSTGQLPMHLAAATGQWRTLEMLRQAGGDWRAPNRAGRHVLAEAALFGHTDVLTRMVAQGIDPATPDVHGLNALHAAALGGQAQSVAWLRARRVPVPHPLSQVLLDQVDQPLPRQP